MTYDSILLEMTEKKCFSMTVVDIVKYPKWQKVRLQVKGIWSTQPEKGLAILKTFLGEIEKADCRDLRAVLNYLAALRGVHKPGIAEYRSQVKAEVDKRRKAL